MSVFVLTLLGFLGFVKTQNLLLIGGALDDNNAAVYEKIVDLAVSVVYAENVHIRNYYYKFECLKVRSHYDGNGNGNGNSIFFSIAAEPIH